MTSLQAQGIYAQVAWKPISTFHTIHAGLASNDFYSSGLSQDPPAVLLAEIGIETSVRHVFDKQRIAGLDGTHSWLVGSQISTTSTGNLLLALAFFCCFVPMMLPM